MSARALAIYLFAPCLFVGCRDQEVEWNYSLAPTLADSASGILAHVREGSCTGERLSTYRFKRGEPTVMPTPIEPGTWGFEVEAYDSTCRRVGVGCVEAVLPPSESGVEAIDVAVDALDIVDPSQCADICDEGICIRADAGA
jgi:hypothetical protein